MRQTLTLILAVTLAAAFPATAQSLGAGAPCGAEASMSEPDCCPITPSASDCQATDCAGWSSVLVIAPCAPALAPRISDSPESFLALPIVPHARAPDTAPPKSVA